jgi:hypothetical protein
MIAKILKPTGKFSAVMYSQKKVGEGKANFSSALNFPFSEDKASPEMYIAYLEALADCTPKNIKNRQFHAIISTKGREHDEVFMEEISKKWMDKMGYGNQPYLLYFHGDTANNHIHIVSSRITIEGKRINPYMEGRRAGIAIRELMNEDLSIKAAFDINDVLQNYSFSTEAQFKLVLEKRGWKVREKDGNIDLIKFVKQGSIEKNKIAEKVQKYAENKQRINQLRAIFNKYSGLPTEQFIDFMRKNFGVEVVFHQSKGHSKPYGYTVIDHHNKIVMKGGEIMPLDALLSPKSRDEHIHLANEIVYNNLLNSYSYRDLKSTLSRNGYYLRKNNIYVKGDDNVLIQLPLDVYKKLHYNDRLNEANNFVLHTSAEAKVLSYLFNVRAREINLIQEIMRDDNIYRDMIQSFGEDKESLKEYLYNNNMRVISNGEVYLLVDSKNHSIADVSGLGLDRDFDIDLERSYERNSANIEDKLESMASASILSGLFSIFGDLDYSHEQDAKAKKKKRKNKLKL